MDVDSFRKFTMLSTIDGAFVPDYGLEGSVANVLLPFGYVLLGLFILSVCLMHILDHKFALYTQYYEYN